MKSRIGLLALLAMGCGMTSYAQTPAAALPATAVSSLAPMVPHLAQPASGLFTGGQPDAAAWKALAEQGVVTVINLRSDAEMHASDEPVRVAAVGMHYVSIPVAGAADVNPANAARLHAAIAAAGGKVLVHCASGNRVGALLAIDAAERRHLPAEQAIAYGKAAGLTRLEPRVRAVLTDTPAASASTR